MNSQLVGDSLDESEQFASAVCIWHKFATKSGGDKIFNRLIQGMFCRGLMDRGGESCKGVGVAVVIKPNNLSLK